MIYNTNNTTMTKEYDKFDDIPADLNNMINT